MTVKIDRLKSKIGELASTTVNVSYSGEVISDEIACNILLEVNIYPNKSTFKILYESSESYEKFKDITFTINKQVNISEGAKIAMEYLSLDINIDINHINISPAGYCYCCYCGGSK